MSGLAFGRRDVIPLALACTLAALVPLWSRERSSGAMNMAEPSWSELVDPGWERTELSSRDRAFAFAQAGPVARFRKGARRLVLRRVSEPSRALHPVSDCLRAVGYHVERLSAHEVESPGASAYRAHRHGELLHVEEWIVDSQGRRFAEVGQWYWQALLGSSHGPWTAYALSWALKSDEVRP